jgi:hypothetical protein
VTDQMIYEPACETPVLDECDVLVIGGGPAGIAAAVGSARVGAKTILVERYGCLGGILSLCMMEPPSWWRQERSTMPGGVVEDLDQRMIKADAVQKTFFRPSTGLAYDTEVFKVIADEYIQENGVIPIFHCHGVSPLMNGNTINGVVTESKSGRMAILAKRVIDCTGDGDIAARAGAPFVMAEDELGALKKGELMGGTLVYGLNNVDTERLEKMVDEDPTARFPSTHRLAYMGFKKAVESGVEIPYGTRKSGTFVYSRVEKHALPALNHAWIAVDGTDVLSLTRAEIDSRKGIIDAIEIMRKYYDGMEQANLRRFSMSIGIRETRRILGEYQIGLRDVFENGRFEDSVGVYPLCGDGPEGTIAAFTEAYFQVPYRITMPLKVENLLVAGRCVSGKRRTYGVTRQVDFAMVTGQATGAASALSVKSDVSSRKVDIKLLQKELEKQGVRVF